MKELTLKQAAKKFKCSTKTLRRRIKTGVIQAKLVKGPKGPEYRILLGLPKNEGGIKIVTTKSEKSQSENLDYKKLYEDLLKRHEQAMMLVGKLQAELQKKMPQLEAQAASLQQKHDELLKLYTEKDRHLQEKDKQLEMKEFIVNELAKELERASAELKRRQASPWFTFRRWLGFA
jgi:chromosome segregation ATPase